MLIVGLGTLGLVVCALCYGAWHFGRSIKASVDAMSEGFEG
jgi:aryl-alcohol dehydrogenase-like predicted oxidoreductase